MTATLSVLSATVARAAVEISSKPTQNMSCQAGVCSPTAQKAVLNVGDLASMLASGDVTISSGSLAQDIEIDAKLNWVSTHRLTLDSYHAILFNKPVLVAGTGALTITTNDGGKDGDFRFFGKGHIEFWDLDSSLVINGHGYNLVKGIKDINKNGGAYAALAKSFSLKRKIYSKAPIESVNVLEGLGNTISDLTIVDTNPDDLVGLVENLEMQGAIRDVRLVSVDIHTSSECVGALVAAAAGNVLNSYATGEITVDSVIPSTIGGLVCAGENVANSCASVAISVTGTATGSVVGGMMGVNFGACFGLQCTGVITGSYSTGTVVGVDGTMVGGLVGQNLGGVILNSYATGAVSVGSDGFAGGLVGSNENNPSEQADPVIANSYSTGSVSGGSGAVVGGLIGQDLADPGITDAYWDTDTSGVNNPEQGAGNIANDPGITGLTTEQFKSGLPAGFDKKVWKEKAGINGGYPYLIDLPPG
ncbi:MAG TPA: GLUG motif-containing protein [Rhizomicrobium sp.]|nr:GLUG motif-containing protein [Rhizomicrobium sp.]